MQSWSLERWDRDVNGFSETDFPQNVRMAKDTLNHNVCFPFKILAVSLEWYVAPILKTSESI